MTTKLFRIHVLLGTLSAVALALVLVADAATAQTSTQRSQKQRRRPIPQEELDRVAPLWTGHTRAGLALPLRLPQATAARRPAGTAGPADALPNREPGITYPIVRGARRVGILPKVLPPFPGPASPIR